MDKKEYNEKGNIRRHAQTIACKECGPKLRYVEIQDAYVKDGKVVHCKVSGKEGKAFKVRINGKMIEAVGFFEMWGEIAWK